MKPDLSDYQTHTNQETEQGSRLVSWIVLGLACSGFLALAWYAYQSGTESVMSGEIPTIEADSSPIKVAPDDAGGEAFPHQDKTIYDVIANEPQIERVEKLIPEPEEPVIPTVKQVLAEAAQEDEEKPKANTWVSEKLRQPEEPKTPAPEELAEVEEAETITKAVEAIKETPAPAPAPVVKAPEPKPEVKPRPKPEPTPEPKPEPTPKPKAEPAAPAKSGTHKLQLGAFGSQEEADANWIRIRGQHAAVLADHPHVVVRADLPKGTFYRLRVSGFDSKDAADAACKTLSARGQGCFYAGK